MARGWESKAIADQIEDRDEVRPAVTTRNTYDASPAVRERNEQIESLRLSRARTVEQLKRAGNSAHRQMLERTLHALDAEIEALS